MELRDIQYFAVLAEHGHFGRAAEALGITQPALSKSLQRLEAALEVRLVERTTKGMRLTSEGLALRARVSDLRLSLQSVTREIKDISTGSVGNLHVGVGNAVSEEFLSTALAILHQSFPRVRINLAVSDNDVMVPALRGGELDIVINYYLAFQIEEIICEHLYYDDYVVCAAANHRLCGREQLELADLVPERWAWAEPSLGSQQKLHETFRDAGLPAPQVGIECRSTSLRLRSVVKSNLLDFTSLAVVRQLASADVNILPIHELTWRRSVGWLRRKESYVSAPLQRFIEILKSVSK
jgi:DNA-binding transcriptional LysR family regulator